MSENIVYTFGGVVSEESPFAFVESTDEERAEMDVPELFVDGFEPGAAAGGGGGEEDGGRSPEKRVAGRSRSMPSWGRSWLYIERNASKRRCCSRKLRASSAVRLSLSVRCIRSWLPLCWGLPGMMKTGCTPSSIRRTLKVENRLRPCPPKGGPLSLSRASGRPGSRKTRTKM